MTKRNLLVIASAGCAVLVVCGWMWLTRYSATPGGQEDAPRHMPAVLRSLASGHGSSGATMFVVLHPQCTCSRATMHELSRVLNETHSVPRIYVLLYRPAVLPHGWSESGVLPLLAAGLNAQVVQDMDGHYAAALRASTSGEVVLYSGNENLLFQGGVTSLRGHEGQSAGSDRLLAALQNQTPSSLAVSVFGCPIFRPS